MLELITHIYSRSKGLVVFMTPDKAVHVSKTDFRLSPVQTIFSFITARSLHKVHVQQSTAHPPQAYTARH